MDDRQLSIVFANILSLHLKGQKRETTAQQLLRLASECIDETYQVKPEHVRYAKAINEVFTFWQKTFNKEKAKLTKERATKIRERLKEGNEQDQIDVIKRAIVNISKNKWFMGDNPSKKQYCDILMICRNATKLEYYSLMSEEDQKIAQKEKVDWEKHDLSTQIREAAQSGNINLYNELNTKLKGIKNNDGSNGKNVSISDK